MTISVLCNNIKALKWCLTTTAKYNLKVYVKTCLLVQSSQRKSEVNNLCDSVWMIFNDDRLADTVVWSVGACSGGISAGYQQTPVVTLVCCQPNSHTTPPHHSSTFNTCTSFEGTDMLTCRMKLFFWSKYGKRHTSYGNINPMSIDSIYLHPFLFSLLPHCIWDKT